MGNKLYYTLITVLALLFCTIAYCFANNQYYSGICVYVLDGDTCLLYTSPSPRDS